MSNLRYVVCADTLYMDGTFEKLVLQLSLHIGQAPHAVTISPLHQIPSFWRPQSVPNSHMEGGVVGTSFPWRGKRGPKSEAKEAFLQKQFEIESKTGGVVVCNHWTPFQTPNPWHR